MEKLERVSKEAYVVDSDQSDDNDATMDDNDFIDEVRYNTNTDIDSIISEFIHGDLGTSCLMMTCNDSNSLSTSSNDNHESTDSDLSAMLQNNALFQSQIRNHDKHLQAEKDKNAC